MLRFIILTTLLTATLWSATTLKTMKKEHRVAMVIGNSDYDDHPLAHATQQARQMKKFLEENGFYVYYGENLDKRNFVRLLRKFNKRLHVNGIGVVYFSGHAVQTKGKNYLVTVDNGILDESMIVQKSISLNFIYTTMDESYDRLNIVILDTGFKDPFGTIFSPQKDGLAPIKSPKAHVTFTSVQPNHINTSDTFGQDFITVAQKKGMELTSVKNKLTQLRRQHHQPKPYIKIVKNQPFYFVLPDHIPAPDELAYTKIKGSDSQEALKRFLERYPHSHYRSKVQTHLDKLLKIEKEKRATAEEQRQRHFKAEAAEATQKAKEQTARKAAILAEQKAQEPNEIQFILSDPKKVKQVKPKHPKKGERRQIILE